MRSSQTRHPLRANSIQSRSERSIECLTGPHFIKPPTTVHLLKSCKNCLSWVLSVSLRNLSRITTKDYTGTVRTRYTGGEFQYEDLTPAAIARELGYSHLFDILAPVMRHYIPANDLINLQSHFHDLIRQDMEGIVKMHHHWLPELSVLTELERPEMWFPVKLGEQSSRVS